MTASEEMVGGNERERLHLAFSCMVDDWIISGNKWTFILTYTVFVQRQDERHELNIDWQTKEQARAMRLNFDFFSPVDAIISQNIL